MLRSILKALAYLLPALALGGTVMTYKDENGTLHAVMNENEIPEKYRAGSKKLAGSTSTESGSGEANVKLVRERNSLMIEVGYGAGGTHLMVLDTGASISMISKKVVLALGLQPIDYANIQTASSLIKAPVVVMPEISVAQFKVFNMKMVVHDLPGAGDRQGLLGVDFLNHFKMELDTETGLLHLKQKPKK